MGLLAPVGHVHLVGARTRRPRLHGSSWRCEPPPARRGCTAGCIVDRLAPPALQIPEPQTALGKPCSLLRHRGAVADAAGIAQLEVPERDQPAARAANERHAPTIATVALGDSGKCVRESVRISGIRCRMRWRTRADKSTSKLSPTSDIRTSTNLFDDLFGL